MVGRFSILVTLASRRVAFLTGEATTGADTLRERDFPEGLFNAVDEGVLVARRVETVVDAFIHLPPSQ